jgi:hypothetical protein
MSATEFVERWHVKAVESADCFDCFFSAWIALVIEARRHLDARQLVQADRLAIIHYFETNAKSLMRVFSDHGAQTCWLSQRRGTGTGGAILDVHPSHEDLRRELDELAKAWSGPNKYQPGWFAKRTAEMINHIRNNMFHGVKDPEDDHDRALLERVNPILLGILASRSR